MKRTFLKCSGVARAAILAGLALFVAAMILSPLPSEAQQALGSPEQIKEYVDRYNALTPEQQQSLRERMTPEQRSYLDRILTVSGRTETPEAMTESAVVHPAPAASMATVPDGASPPRKIIAGVPTELTYTVTVRNLSGVPVVNPVVRDNGRILNNDDAVKTGGNQDNILEVGETWTWTYTETVTGTAGERIVNTATVEGPDDANRDTDPDNNRDETVVEVAPAPGHYDLSVTKSVSVTGQQEETPGITPEETETRPEQTITTDDCGNWLRRGSGGYKGTRDPYDISALPQGTTFDIRWNTRGIPDRYIVEYPVGTQVFDSGWRGRMDHLERRPQVAHLYPGGIVGPIRGEQANIFTKGAANEMLVIVLGPEQGTAWDYEIRANCP